MRVRLLPLAGLLLSLPAAAQSSWSTYGNSASKTAKLGTTNLMSLRFYTYNKQRMILTPGGRLGIGTDNPAYMLDVAGKAKAVGDTAFVGIGGGANDSFKDVGVFGKSNLGTGVSGRSLEGAGVEGESINTAGGFFRSQFGHGLVAETISADFAAFFIGNLFTTGQYTGSDARLKTGVKEVITGLAMVGKLKPRLYSFRHDLGVNLPKGEHFGFIAQDVEQVVPQAVKEVDLKGHTIKAVNYTELIPVLTAAVQELSQQVTALKEEVARMKGNTSASLSSSWVEAVSNPVISSAAIRYYVPGGGRLIVQDGQGRQVKALTLSGTGTLNLEVSGLAAGVYYYTLVVDGKKGDSKKLTVTR